MSKYDLQHQASELSGVSHEQSMEIHALGILDRIGGTPGFQLLSELFYDSVFEDKLIPQYQWFVNIFATSTKEEAVANQYTFLVQTFGGPPLYSEAPRHKGKYVRLVGRHAAYPIGTAAAERWIHHMSTAIDRHPALSASSEECKRLREALLNYFRYTAYYIVVASQFMRSDQVRK
jgi:hemoglobin